jgi:hypothetical protein
MQEQSVLSLQKLDEMYQQEKDSYTESKQKASVFKDLDERYEQNRKSLDQEFGRLKSIIYDFKF